MYSHVQSHIIMLHQHFSVTPVYHHKDVL